MRVFLCTFLGLLFAGTLSAQFCMGNDMYADSSAGVYPPPFDPIVTPNGGITENACINKGFEFTFTIVVGETITIGGITQNLDSIVLLSVDDMPIGMNVDCNPPNCVYPAGLFGCARIWGTATDANAPGDYSLSIKTNIFANGSPFPLPFTFPSPLVAPGSYILTLEPENSTNCIVGTDDVLASQVSINNAPNPSNGLTQIEINSDVNDDFQFRVLDLLGNQVHTQAIQVREGENLMAFDGSDLPNGVYIYSIGNELGVVSKKMIIQH